MATDGQQEPDARMFALIRCLVIDIEQIAIYKYVTDSSKAKTITKKLRHAVKSLENIKSTLSQQGSGACDPFEECPSGECVADLSDCRPGQSKIMAGARKT
jgi:hypothetical protein